MSAIPGFVGGSNVLSSDLHDCELTVNAYVESGAPGTPKTEKRLQDRPGLRLAFSVGDDPISTGFVINDRCFGIAGTVFFEQFADDSILVRGAVAASGSTEFPLATMCSNGTAGDQVFITSGGYGYIYTLSTDTLTLIADMDFPQGDALMGEFFAGYFLVLVSGTRTIQWSALEDGTDWDALDVFERSWASDNIVGMKRLGTHIWLVGNRTSEVLYATGGIEIFAPAQESLIDHGCLASFSMIRAEDGSGKAVLAWLSQSEHGGGLAVIAEGLTPSSISTYANAVYLQSRGHNMQQARSFAMQINGHIYFVLNNEEVEYPFTPVYDFSENLWYDWAHWDSTQVKWVPFRGQCHWYFDQRHFVGDRLTGAVYEFDPDTLADHLADVA